MSDRAPGRQPIVSVIIPCYNHARFLSDAIESVLRQTVKAIEIVVVDDGSKDHTAQVAAGYEQVQYVYQTNQGLAAARNTGIRESRGDLLCFLDADDVLAPHAIETGMRALAAHPECAFASGDYRLVDPDLRPLLKLPRRIVERDHYLEFLRGNYIGMHATVLYRRAVLEAIGGFNESMRACEDYELYLRVARQYPVVAHGEVIADYRQHGLNMSGNPQFMLKWALAALEGESRYVTGNPARERAFRQGQRAWRQLYAERTLERLRFGLRRLPSWGQALRWCWFVVRNHDTYSYVRERGTNVLTSVRGRVLPALERLTKKLTRRKIRLGSFAAVKPLMADGKGQIYSWYERRLLLHYGIPDIAAATVVSAASLVSDSPRLPGPLGGAIVCTDLHRVWEPDQAVACLKKATGPDGFVVAVLPGVAVPDSAVDTSDYWRFTTLSARRMFESHFASPAVEVTFLGNVAANVAALHGLPADVLTEEELLVTDVQQQLIVAVRAIPVAT